MVYIGCIQPIETGFAIFFVFSVPSGVVTSRLLSVTLVPIYNTFILMKKT